MIQRQEYLNTLIGFRDKDVMKVITGIRRCGKSTLLELFQDYLRNDGIKDEQILAINFEDYQKRHLKDADKLHDYVLKRASSIGKTYVFLDEIQQVPDFEEVVDSLYLRKNLDIYLTGSNAQLLSGDIATLLSGRYVEIQMLPLSFSEFLTIFSDKNNLADKYQLYLQNSAFPGVVGFGDNQKLIADYIYGIYNSVVISDVIQRHKITDIMMLESIIHFAYDNTGNLLSTKKISDFMNSGARKIDVKTVEKYLKALVDSFILYRAKRYNIRGKQHLKTLAKYYAVDLGLRRILLGNDALDVGHLLENVVYLELLRRGYQVYVGKVDDLEIDFVAKNENGLTYFQVAATVRDKSTLARELAPLRKIKDHNPKILLTLDDDPDMNYDGIKRRNALKWLADSR